MIKPVFLSKIGTKTNKMEVSPCCVKMSIKEGSSEMESEYLEKNYDRVADNLKDYPVKMSGIVANNSITMVDESNTIKKTFFFYQ